MNPVIDKQYYYIYVLRSRKNSLWYTGFTDDLRKRFTEHNKEIVGWKKNRGPFDLIYYEASMNTADARSGEKYLKSGMGKRYLKNRLKRFLSLTG
ncbi:MAG: GIY-YIG nuclease superfamily protein [Parcubacteria group bacterium GW2011_GWC1_45_9]|nr:MAG: GIY-YIG nuclease superfamily protein [Parcubacteria group bacterium GW2011_GWA1_Parcubacteria_45_10]KKT89284.1 MAG: GIY-YIG nuclease superfamily protein [Parcubacteria group bacterium GW2011_GWB1_45_10]KKU17218.1 MAG: GIY-YIG nuclease superfamily protein [Parcubacteria group bacterium GW2011_GWC1_45_9]HCI05495.1 excinuclease ABC subunit C [Patescibacteria group bacterium]